MKMYSLQNAPRELVTSWIAQYGRLRPDCATILNRLPQTATADQVDAAFESLPFGNTNRVNRKGYECDECGKTKPKVIEVGQEPDYDSHTATICLDCLEKAIKIMRSSQ